jgi:hypothetical protein
MCAEASSFPVGARPLTAGTSALDPSPTADAGLAGGSENDLMKHFTAVLRYSTKTILVIEMRTDDSRE